jgi:hypothetical protein
VNHSSSNGQKYLHHTWKQLERKLKEIFIDIGAIGVLWQNKCALGSKEDPKPMLYLVRL